MISVHNGSCVGRSEMPGSVPEFHRVLRISGYMSCDPGQKTLSLGHSSISWQSHRHSLQTPNACFPIFRSSNRPHRQLLPLHVFTPLSPHPALIVAPAPTRLPGNCAPRPHRSYPSFAPPPTSFFVPNSVSWPQLSQISFPSLPLGFGRSLFCSVCLW